MARTVLTVRRTSSGVDVRITTIDPAGFRRRRKRRARRIVAAGGITVLTFALLLVSVVATTGVRHELRAALGRTLAPRVIDTSLIDGAIDPSVVLLEPGAVRFRVRNSGGTPCRFAIQGPGVSAQTDDLAPGVSASLDLILTRPGRYRLLAVSASGAPLSRGMLEVRR